MDFGDAIRNLKDGKRIARKGWNGKGMFLVLIHGNSLTETIHEKYGNPEDQDNKYPVLDSIYMKTATNELVSWLASQTDMLSEDWVVVQ